MSDIDITFALVGAVLMLAGAFSGIVRLIPVSFPMIFLGLGLILGDGGLGWMEIGVHDHALEAVGILCLAFVLQLDAINLRLDEIRENWRVLVLSLGPGTLLTAAIIALAARWLLDLSTLEALLLGAILASIDPVVLRDVVQDERVPRSIRKSLQTEAATNDLVALPLVLIFALIIQEQTHGFGAWATILFEMFVLGPLAGVIVGFLTVWIMAWARRHFHIERVYRALFGTGSVLIAFVAGEAAGGSGFLAAFASGAVIVALDDDLCDCFLEYSEATAEMAMLLAFVLFGALLSSILDTIEIVSALLLALVVIGIARPIAMGLVLRRAVVSKHARLFIGWFGPRGLSSLLFALVVVGMEVEGAETLVAYTGVVVMVSVVLHGMSALPLAAWYGRALSQTTYPEERATTVATIFHLNPDDAPRITVAELAVALESDDPPLVLDVRTRSSHLRGSTQIPGSIRVQPDDVEAWAAHHLGPRRVVTYCT